MQTGASASETTFQAPSGWSAANASDDELKYMGFPARPADPAALARWNATVGRAVPQHVTLCRERTAGRHTSMNTGKPFNSSVGYSGNWSGEEAWGTTYASMFGEYYQAKTVNGCADPNSSLSTWIGLTQHGTSSGPSLMTSTGVPNTNEGTLNAWTACGSPGL